MTDFEKVKSYYSVFNEWGRLDAPEGRLEFELTMPIITNHLPQKAEILDLGGGPGRYSIELAKIVEMCSHAIYIGRKLYQTH